MGNTNKPQSSDLLKMCSDEYHESSPKYSDFAVKLLEDCTNTEKPKPISLQEIIANSNEFPIQFPIETCRIKSQPVDRLPMIEKHIESAYPVVHERVLWLYTRFLEHKLKYGCDIEKNIYKNMSLIDLIDRLLKKRCVLFCDQHDHYLTLTGDIGFNYHLKNRTDPNDPISIHNLLSYDEIKLSALLSISSGTEFINNGNRHNRGVVEDDKTKIECDGIIMGYIGARLVKINKMEFEDVLISVNQNTKENGYGPKPNPSYMSSVRVSDEMRKNYDYRDMWNRFYDSESYLYDQVQVDDVRFIRSFKNMIFDNLALEKRNTIPFDTLLLESESRSRLSGKKGYIHVVGIGLGVWRIEAHQPAEFLRTFEQRIKYLLPMLKNIGWIHFSWINASESGDIRNGNTIKSSKNPDGIKIFLSNRNPAEKLDQDHYKNALLIVSYAWDGNALPGNEFWLGSIGNSSDSATASSTLVTELHNPHINKGMICGNNLHIASPQYGVLHIADYVKVAKFNHSED